MILITILLTKEKRKLHKHKHYLALKAAAVATDIQSLMWEVDYLEVVVVVLKGMAEEHLLNINPNIFHSNYNFSFSKVTTL